MDNSRKARQSKVKWTPEEDALLKLAVEELGTNNWTMIATRVPERSGKQCRERWTGQISPSITKVAWTPSEDMTLIFAQKAFGNKWATIAQFLPSRSPISIKNRWNWYTRHQQTIPTPISSPPPRVVFEPIKFRDNEIFGKGFEEFQMKLLSELQI